MTGEEIIYENWGEGLPNNFSDGYYAHITDGGNTDCYSGNILCGVWDDHGNTNNLTTAFYVVEFETSVTAQIAQHYVHLDHLAVQMTLLVIIIQTLYVMTVAVNT